jgi:hypothetical protein
MRRTLKGYAKSSKDKLLTTKKTKPTNQRIPTNYSLSWQLKELRREFTTKK